MDTIDTIGDTLLKFRHVLLPTKRRNSKVGKAFLTELAQQSEMGTDAALTVLEDAFSGVGYGMALLDEEHGLILFNQDFSELFFDGASRPKVGDLIQDRLQNGFRDGHFIAREGQPTSSEADAVFQAIRDMQGSMELQRCDNRFLEISSKTTQLGGALVTVKEITDQKRFEDAEKSKWSAISEVVSALDQGFALWDAEFRFIMCNDTYMRDISVDRDGHFEPGMRGQDVLSEFFRSGQSVLPEGMTEEEYLERNMAWARSYGPPQEVRYKDGRVVVTTAKKTDLGGVLTTTRDVTEERNSEARARNILRQAIEALGDAILLFDKDLRLELSNAKTSEMLLGGMSSFVSGATFGEIWADLGTSGVLRRRKGHSVEDQVREAEEQVRTFTKNSRINTKDGRTLLASSFPTEQGGYLITFSDRTDQLRLESLFSNVIENLPVGVGIESSDNKLSHCNEAFARFYGVSADTLKTLPRDKRLSILISELAEVNGVPADEVATDVLRQRLQDHANNFAPIELKLKDDRHFFAERAQTDQGDIIQVLTDTTTVKSEQERRLSSINEAMEATSEALVLYDRDGRFVLANQAWFKSFCSVHPAPKPGEHMDTFFRSMIDSGFYVIPEDVTAEEFYEIGLDAVYTHRQNLPVTTADGRSLLGSSHKTGLDGYLLSFRDVTEEHDANAKARDMLLDAFQALDEGMVLCDENMNFVFGNDAWKEINFDGREHMIPKPGDSVIENVVSLVKSGHYAIPDGMNEDDYISWVMGAMSEHGKRVPVSFANGRHIVGSSHLTKFGGALLFIRDVTKQIEMEAELSEQREAAHQNEKLSALGELLAGVAHELNNPLSVVFGYSQMLQGKITDPVLSERVDLICQSSERAAKIVRTFLAMARQRPTKMEACSINDIVETAMEVSSYSLKTNGTEVTVSLDETAPAVLGDFDQLAQVFSNLIVNAGHAVRDKADNGKIAIHSRVVKGQIEVEISDNGNGIPEDIQSRIFEPFFTTKDVGEGTGIGLAFSHRIVKGHEGTLTLKSKIGNGASFFVRLPSEGSSEDAEALVEETSGTARSVLVVDDEEGVARLISDMLSDEGFLVTKSTDPRAALRLAEATEFDVILSDFKMPQMDGETFFRSIEVIAPENAKRTAFVTGDAMSAQIVKFLAASKRPHIEKPIMKNELLALIARATDEVSE